MELFLPLTLNLKKLTIKLIFKENKRLPPKPYMSGATVPFPALLCFLMARTAPPMAPVRAPEHSGPRQPLGGRTPFQPAWEQTSRKSSRCLKQPHYQQCPRDKWSSLNCELFHFWCFLQQKPFIFTHRFKTTLKITFICCW